MSNLRKCIDMVEGDLCGFGCSDFQNISNLIKEIENYISESVHVLEVLDEYFDDYAEADCNQNGHIPNTEMQHKVRIEEVLKLV